MADTRELYLVCNDGTVFGSDPTNNFIYLDMSSESNLNSKASSTIYDKNGSYRVVENYEITLDVIHATREARELFAIEWLDKVWAFGVTSRSDKSKVFTKRAIITGYEFVDNSYLNGVLTQVTIQLLGKWQSSLNYYYQPAPNYSNDGTKKYNDGLWNGQKAPDYGTGGTNLIVASSIINAMSMDNNGANAGYPTTFITDYIPVVAGEKYTVSTTLSSSTSRIAFYDSSKVFISRLADQGISNTVSQTITIPTDVSFIRFSPNEDNGKYENNFKFEMGTTATPYSPSPLDLPFGYQYYHRPTGTNTYKYGSTNYANTFTLASDDNYFLFAFNLLQGQNYITIANSQYSVKIGKYVGQVRRTMTLGNEGIDYTLSNRDAVHQFSLWNGGTLMSQEWEVDDMNDYFKLLQIFSTIATDPISIIGQGEQGTSLSYDIWTYTKIDFI